MNPQQERKRGVDLGEAGPDDEALDGKQPQQRRHRPLVHVRGATPAEEGLDAEAMRQRLLDGYRDLSRVFTKLVAMLMGGQPDYY